MVVGSASWACPAYPQEVTFARRLMAALTAALVATLLAISPASAHSDLISTDPADGAVLDVAPTEVVFTFSEPLLPDFVRFIRISPTGATEDAAIAAIDNNVARVIWPAGLPGGEWTLEYRVVSQDGHPVNGSIFFSYPDAAPTPAPEPSPTTSSAPDPTTQSAPTPTPTAPTPSPDVSPAADESGSTTGWLIAGIAVIALAIIVIIGLVVRRR